jgi:hypothetical protein
MSVARQKTLIGFPQMVRAHRWIVLVFFISAAVIAHAQDQEINNPKKSERWFYQTLEPSFRNNFDASAQTVSQSNKYVSPAVQGFLINNLKMLMYNEVSIRVGCLSDVASQHQSTPLADIDAPKSETNAQINECIEKRLHPLKSFGTFLLQYGGSFTENAWKRCELKARLLEGEKILPPYDFLKPSGSGSYFAGKLFDLEIITTCLKATM